MAAINGFIVQGTDQETGRSERVIKKLRILARKLSLQTKPSTCKNFGFSLVSTQGITQTHEDFIKEKKPLSKIWEEDLNSFDFEEDLSIYFSSSSEKENQGHYIFENIHSAVMGTSKDFEINQNPSKLIKEQGFLKGISTLKEEAPSVKFDFNIVSFDTTKPKILNLYRGIFPFRVLYSFMWNSIIFSCDHRNNPIISKDDLLARQPFLPLDLEPYGAYIIDLKKITFADQSIILNGDLCCKQLEKSIEEKRILLDYTEKRLYHPNDLEYYLYCPFCGAEIHSLIGDE